MSDDLHSRGGRDRSRVDVKPDPKSRRSGMRLGDSKRPAREAGDRVDAAERRLMTKPEEMPAGVPDVGTVD